MNEIVNEKPHVSPSQLDMFFRCGEQYRRRYVLGEKIPPGVSLIKGRAVHKAAQVNYEQKMETGHDLPLSILTEAAAADIELTVAEDGLALTEDEEKIGAKKVLGETKDASVRLAGLFLRDVAPRVQPILVEEFVRIELPNHSHDLLGRLDVADQQDVIRDLKTGARKKTQADADGSDQLTFYSIAFRQRTGRQAKGVALDVLVDTKTPNAQFLTSERTAKDEGVYLAKLNSFLVSLKSGVFLPAAPGAWNCSAKWCGYWSTCPYVNSDRKAAAETFAA